MKQFVFNALILWSTTLVPCLLPIMIVSRLLIASNAIFLLLRPFSFLCRKLLRLSPGGSYALLLGYTCGYPMGVKMLADLRSVNAISQKEACYLAGFINHVSPAFLITYVCQELLNSRTFMMPCIVMIYGASLLYGVLKQFVPKSNFPSDSEYHPKKSDHGYHFRRNGLQQPVSFLALLDAVIEDSLMQMLKIGGYMVLFSLLSFLVCHIPGLSDVPKASLCALLEISLGCKLLASLSVPFFWKYLLLIGALTFGGLCSAFQSASFLKKIGLPLKQYLKDKAITVVIALGMFLIYV